MADISTQVAQRIKNLRLERGLSRRELAKRSGLLLESISRTEKGVTNITIANLAKVCAALEVDLPTFFAFARQGL